MNRITILSLAAVFLFNSGMPPRDGCDLSKVVKGHYCAHDKVAFDKSEVVSGTAYWHCAACDAGRPTEGPCNYCKKATVKKTAGTDVCPKCFRGTTPCEVCVKSIFACTKCGHSAAAAGACPKCKTALTAKTSRSVVKYSCADCGKTSATAGKCTDADCTSKGKDLKKTCDH